MSRSKNLLPEIRVAAKVSPQSVAKKDCEKLLAQFGMYPLNTKHANKDNSYDYVQWNDNPREEFKLRIRQATEAARLVSIAIAPEKKKLYVALGDMEGIYLEKCQKINREKDFQRLFALWLRELDYCLTQNLEEKLENIPVMTWMDKANAYVHLLQPAVKQIAIRKISKQNAQLKGGTQFKTLSCSEPLTPLPNNWLEGFLYPDSLHQKCPDWYQDMPDYEKKLFNHTFQEFNCVNETNSVVIEQKKRDLNARLRQLPTMLDSIPGVSNFSREDFFYVEDTEKSTLAISQKAGSPDHEQKQIGLPIYQATMTASQQKKPLFSAMITRIIQNYKQERPDLALRELRKKTLFLQLPPGVDKRQLPQQILLPFGQKFHKLNLKYLVVNHSNNPMPEQNVLDMVQTAIDEQHPESMKLQILQQQLNQMPLVDINQQALHKAALESMMARRLGCISCSFFEDEARKKMQLTYEYTLEIYWELYGTLPKFSVEKNKDTFIALFMKISALEKGSRNLPNLENIKKIYETLFDWRNQSVKNQTFSQQKEAWINWPLHKSRLHGAAKAFALSALVAIPLILVPSILAFYITIPTIFVISAVITGCFILAASSMAGAAIESFWHHDAEEEKWGRRQAQIARAINLDKTNSSRALKSITAPKPISLAGIPEEESDDQSSRRNSTVSDDFLEDFPDFSPEEETSKSDGLSKRKQTLSSLGNAFSLDDKTPLSTSFSGLFFQPRQKEEHDEENDIALLPLKETSSESQSQSQSQTSDSSEENSELEFSF